ncbi:MAG: pyridoxamine 5'-phosphate oxidase family protein, partial [Allomuricauda sp.]
MGRRLDKLNQPLIDFIQQQKVFFVATAMEEGSINLSPKGLDSLRIVNENRVVWLNLTGSGNETAAHLGHNSRITLMFCAFEGDPMILRLYGTAKIHAFES